MDVDLDLHISLFDFLISGVLIWGIYKGYLQGVLVQAIALFALLAGVFISAKLSVSFYNVIIDKSTVALPNLPVIIFAIFFGFVVFFSNFIALRVQNEVTPVPKGLYSRGLGAFFGALKYAFIISIFLIFINKLDQNFDIISVKEKQRTKLFNPFLKLAPTAIPRLNFEIREPELMVLPEVNVNAD